jgi:hypothetical protein
VPVFLGLNTGGNWTVARDPGVRAANEKARGRAISCAWCSATAFGSR